MFPGFNTNQSGELAFYQTQQAPQYIVDPLMGGAVPSSVGNGQVGLDSVQFLQGLSYGINLSFEAQSQPGNLYGDSTPNINPAGYGNTSYPGNQYGDINGLGIMMLDMFNNFTQQFWNSPNTQSPMPIEPAEDPMQGQGPVHGQDPVQEQEPTQGQDQTQETGPEQGQEPQAPQAPVINHSKLSPAERKDNWALQVNKIKESEPYKEALSEFKKANPDASEMAAERNVLSTFWNNYVNEGILPADVKEATGTRESRRDRLNTWPAIEDAMNSKENSKKFDALVDDYMIRNNQDPEDKSARKEAGVAVTAEMKKNYINYGLAPFGFDDLKTIKANAKERETRQNEWDGKKDEPGEKELVEQSDSFLAIAYKEMMTPEIQKQLQDKGINLPATPTEMKEAVAKNPELKTLWDTAKEKALDKIETQYLKTGKSLNDTRMTDWDKNKIEEKLAGSQTLQDAINKKLKQEPFASGWAKLKDENGIVKNSYRDAIEKKVIAEMKAQYLQDGTMPEGISKTKVKAT